MSKQQFEQNPKLPPKRGRPVDMQKDRVTFHINVDTRTQIEKLIPEWGKSLSMVVRKLVNLGLEVVSLSNKGITPRSGNLEDWLASYTSLGTELTIACETLNLSVPKSGQVAIWLLDKMAFGSNDPHVISEELNTTPNLLERIRLGKQVQTFSFKQGLELPQNEEFLTWLEQLYDNALIGQEFVTTCQTLGLQPPQKGEIEEWLLLKMGQHPQLEQSNVAEADSTAQSQSTEDDLLGVNSQPFLEYLLTLDKMPTEEEQFLIASRFGVESTHLTKLISRMMFEEKG
ncbi:hypothetical protein Riv7116_4967 [Rivularia sp. PCC 7116]|uniref:hypothetical protein n=1 Tax=Rivularia sp. PCC 7116 TaxID=373994 RepID=UPI00029F37B5|nr:hypothetical protein [Rivularia sp. PCC 7116]AFY57374.1 hypothetical protein Riv7116_4967 [Rivularia sp. PCC 7116]